MSGLLEPLDDRPAAPAARRKSSILDLLTRRNSSSPELDKVPNRNFSTRSLSRLGSFGASTTALPSLSPSSKSSPTVSPVESNFSVSDLSLPKEQAAPRDYFTLLPHEVQLQIVSYLPLKTIRRFSSVMFLGTLVANCRFPDNGAFCVRMGLYLLLLIPGLSIELFLHLFC